MLVGETQSIVSASQPEALESELNEEGHDPNPQRRMCIVASWIAGQRTQGNGASPMSSNGASDQMVLELKRH